MIFRIWHEMERKYGFPLSVYTHYQEDGPDRTVPLTITAYPKFKELISDAVHYSELEKLINAP